MSKILRFSGSSDDNFEIEGALRDEISKFDHHGLQFKLSSSEGQLLVVGIYGESAPGAVWTVGIAPVEEDVPIPEWPVKVRLAENGYSTELEIEVPDDTFVTGYADGVLIEGAGGQC